jgi:DNA modification methylase
MNLVPINSILIPENRQRKEFTRKELDDLKKSILSKGLLHPPVVRNDGVTLIAGERRLRALKELFQEEGLVVYHGEILPDYMIPVTKLAELDPLDVMEAELEENVIRVDLTWQEKAFATRQLSELRKAQAAKEDKPYSVADLTAEIHGSKNSGHGGIVKEILVLAENMHIPEVAKAKTQKEAVKALKKIKQTEWRAELAAKVDLKKVEHDLRCGDMFQLTPTLPDGYFDLILADPPYGVDADSFGDMSDTGHNYKDDWETAHAIYRFIAIEGYRIAKQEAHCYIFCSIEHFQKISAEFDLAGWDVWPRPLIWSKGNGMLSRPEHGPRYTYECILFASRGGRKVLSVRNDVISVSGDKRLSHGAQKPVDLYVDLISRSCLPGNRIFDPTGGSGTTISAAIQTRCVATLFEIDPGNFNLCLGRLKDNALDQIDLELEEEE